MTTEHRLTPAMRVLLDLLNSHPLDQGIYLEPAEGRTARALAERNLAEYVVDEHGHEWLYHRPTDDAHE